MAFNCKQIINYCNVLYASACIVIFLQSAFIDAQNIGVCYGRMGDNLPPPQEVATMYPQYGIGKMRTYDADATVIAAFQDTSVEIMVGVPNDEVQTLALNLDAAKQWFNTNIKAYYPGSLVQYISVGNEILPDDLTNAPFILLAMQNIQVAIEAANLQDYIKVSTTHKFGILDNSYPPSAGAFSPQVAAYLKPILEFIDATESAFLVNVYPYFSYLSNPKSISIDYALFTSTNPITDGNLVYQNLFVAMVDAVISAMEALGFPDLRVVVAETGWPSSGNNVATLGNAQTYNNNLIKHVLSTAGTPKRPGESIETFVFALFNEDQKPGDTTHKNFGLFYPETRFPVYLVNFTKSN